MSHLQFISSLVSSLAWPAAIISSIWILRKELKQLLPFISSLKAPGVEITIDRQQVTEAKELAESALPESSTSKSELDRGDFDLVFKLLDISPRHALIESWRLLEHIGVSALGESAIENMKPHLRSPASFGEALRSSGRITSEEMSIIMKLRTVRNQATHLQEFQVDEATARDYAETAFKLWNVLKTK